MPNSSGNVISLYQASVSTIGHRYPSDMQNGKKHGKKGIENLQIRTYSTYSIDSCLEFSFSCPVIVPLFILFLSSICSFFHSPCYSFYLCHLRIDWSVFRQLLTIFVEYSFFSLGEKNFTIFEKKIARKLSNRLRI